VAVPPPQIRILLTNSYISAARNSCNG